MREFRPALTAAAAAGALAAAGCAHAGPQQVRPGETTSGLGLVGPKVPEVLKQAKADAYAPPSGSICEAAPREIAALDEILGPDADAPPQKEAAVNPGKLITKAVRGLIPHRDVLRFLTQAGKKEKELADAAMAGWARRGYLKGLVRTHCDGPMEPPLQTAAPSVDAASANANAVVPDVTPAPLETPPLDPVLPPLKTASAEASPPPAAPSPVEVAR